MGTASEERMTVEELRDSLGSVAIIGGGKMGEAILAGLLSAGAVDPSRVIVANPSEEKRLRLSATYGVSCVSDGADISYPDTVVLAVKPQVLPAIAQKLAVGSQFAPRRVISIAAGVKLESLMSWFHDTCCVRAMPNTPLMVGAGMTAVSVADPQQEHEVAIARAFFGCMGEAVIVDESLQNAATAVSGSGPAYFALFVDALAQAGIDLGLEEDASYAMALATMRGTGELLEKKGMTPKELIKAVSSPGGTTVAALERMREGDVEQAICAGAFAAAHRAEELG